MPVDRITKRTVDALKPSSTDRFLWDSEIRGFGLKVTPSGRKSYVVQYRMPGLGRRGFARRITLGDHGLLAPEEARRRAKHELGKVASGIDPSRERAAEKSALTVKELGLAFLSDVEARRKISTSMEYRRLWAKHVLPALGSKQVGKINAVEIRRVHRAMRVTPFLANRVVAMLGAFFTFAAKEGAIPPHNNPAHEIEFYPEARRERFLTADEFRRLGEALTRAETSGLPSAPVLRRKPKSQKNRKHVPKSAGKPIPANPYAVAAIRLLALTGCRENEILSLRWDAVDIERGYLRFSDTKTGRNARPLGATAAVLIQTLPRMAESPFVFPGQKTGTHLKEIKRTWYAARHAARLSDVRLHDLRHSYASVPASGGESMLVLRSLLGHKRVATTERYAHLGDDPVRAAADRTSQTISALLSPENSSDG